MNAILIFLLIHCTIITHELAHYFSARFFKIPIEEVCFGSGIKLASWHSKHTNTNFTLKLFPIKGYTRVQSAYTKFTRRSMKNAIFDRQPLWKRTLVVLAGPIVDLLGAGFFYVLLHFSSHCAVTPALYFIFLFYGSTVYLNSIPMPGSDNARLFSFLCEALHKSRFFPQFSGQSHISKRRQNKRSAI